MRSTRSFVLLALVTVGVVVATLYVQYQSHERAEEKALLFPMLAQRLNEAAELRISQGEFSVALRRQGKNSWQVRERADYPADRAKIHELLLGSAGLERREEKTRNPRRYGQLGLAEAVGEGEEGQLATRIAIHDGKGRSLAAFFLGRRVPAKDRTARQLMFARLPDDPAVWLVEGNLPHGNKVAGWLRKDILALDRARIRAVRITRPDGGTITVEKDDPGNFDYRIAELPTELPGDTEPSSPAIVNSIVASVTSLQLQDVRRLEALDLSTKKPGATVLITTFDGMRITMNTWQSQENVLVRLDADFDSESALPPEPRRESFGTIPSGHGGIGGIGDVGAQAASDPRAMGARRIGNVGIGTRFAARESGNRGIRTVKKEVADLAGRWRGWVYVLPAHRMEYLAKRTKAKGTRAKGTRNLIE